MRASASLQHVCATGPGCVLLLKEELKSKRLECWSRDCCAAPAEVSKPALLWLLSGTPCSAGKPAHDCGFAREGGLDTVGACTVTSRCSTKERTCIEGPQNQCGEDRCSRRAACDPTHVRDRLRWLAVLPSPPPTGAANGNRWPPSRCSCAFVLDMRRPSRRTRRRRAAGLDLVRQPQRRADGVEGVGLRPGRWLLVLGASGGLSV